MHQPMHRRLNVTLFWVAAAARVKAGWRVCPMRTAVRCHRYAGDMLPDALNHGPPSRGGMMKLSLSISKFTPPSLPRIVDRPRLTDRLKRNRKRKIVLVTGQAAQGKSTLIAAYLGGTKEPTAWLHLDREDSDHVNFFYLLVHALQFALQNQDFSGFLKNPHMTLGAREAVARFDERLISLFKQLRTPVRIVLDGLDSLSPEASCYRLIETMGENLPDRCVLYLISRIIPPLKLEGLRIKQTALTLANEDLAFTGPEIRRFFRMTRDLDLSEAQVDQIHKITGGWAGGLILISESLGRLPASDRTGYMAHHLPADLKQESLKYFSEEIFYAQPQAIQSFLIKSAVLDVIDPEILTDLVGMDDVRSTIAELVRRNLFIQPIYDRHRGWTYRYNALFRAFLQSIFTADIAETSRHRLLKQAATLYWEKGQFEEAIRYYLKAEAHEEAAAGIKKIGTDLAICGRFADLTDFLQALPSEMVTEDPWLLYFLTLTRKISGGNRNIADLKRCLTLFEHNGDTRGRILALAFLIETLVFLGRDPAEIGRWTRRGEKLLQALGDTPYYAYAKTMLWLQIGFGQITGGALQRGLSACRNAFLMARKIKDVTLQINATIVSVLGLSLAGEFQQADAALDKLAAFIGGSDSPEYRTLQHIVKIDLSLNKGDFDTAAQLVEKTQKDIETYGLLFLYPALIDATGRLHVYRHDFQEAEKVRKHLADVAVLASNRYYEGLSQRLAGMLQYYQGHYRKAAAFAERALGCLTANTTESLYTAQVRLLLGLIRLHLKAQDLAEQDVMAARDYFDRAGSPIASAECLLALALVHRAQGRDRSAGDLLTAGFHIAETKRYEHMPIMGPSDLLHACTLAVALDVAPAVAYATHLMGTRLASVGEAAMDTFSRDRVFRDRSIPVAVKRLIHLTRVPFLDIRTLGGFGIFRDGKVPIADPEWSGQRPKMLLKAIVVHGAREIPRDILIDALWPDSRPEAAQKNLKVNLHRLRKVLEPTLNPRYGSSYIHLKNNLVSLDKDLCRIDVETFLGVFKKIKQCWETADADDMRELCLRAESLYRGDFLPEEPYISWAEIKRDMLREHQLTILMKLADIYENRGNLERAAHYCRTVVRIDPFQENAQQRLMRLYSASGMKSAALKVYETFAAFMNAEIGEMPDPATTDLYRQILRRH